MPQPSFVLCSLAAGNKPMPELCSCLLWALAEPLNGQVLMVLSMDNNCSATSFDMELCAEKLQSLGVQVSSSHVIPLGRGGGSASFASAPTSQTALLYFLF